MREKRGKYKHVCGVHITKELGLKRSALYAFRRSNPESFAFMLSFDDDVVTSYRMWEAHKEEVVEKAREIYIWLEDNRLKERFGKFLVNEGVYTNKGSYKSTETALFSSRGIVFHTSLMLIKRSNELFDKFNDYDRYLNERPLRSA